MRSWYAALTAGFAIMTLAACVTPSIPIPPPGPPPKPGQRVELPTTLAKVSKVCHWAEAAGNAPASTAATDSMRHKHVSIVNWKLIPKMSWIQMYPRKGSLVKFNPELSYTEVVDPEANYSEMELLDFRLVNGERPPVQVELPLTSEQLCEEAAPATVGKYYDGPFMLSVSPLQNAEVTNTSEHVIVYAPLKAELKDGEHNWWVLLIWHVRSAEECNALKDPSDRTSCLALLELADLDPSRYNERAPQLLAQIKYPFEQYRNSATKSHNGVIHGIE